MAITKTAAPWFYMDDTPANVAAALTAEKIHPNNVFITTSNFDGKIFCLAYKPGSKV